VQRGGDPLGQGVEHPLLRGGVGLAVGPGRHRDGAARHPGVVEQAHAAPVAVHRALAHRHPDRVADALDEHHRGPGAQQRERVVGELPGGALGGGRLGQGDLGPAEPLDLVDLEPTVSRAAGALGPDEHHQRGHQGSGHDEQRAPEGQRPDQDHRGGDPGRDHATWRRPGEGDTGRPVVVGHSWGSAPRACGSARLCTHRPGLTPSRPWPDRAISAMVTLRRRQPEQPHR
jgi:hypothetical protein